MPLSPNLVCIPPPPTDIKADGEADTAYKSSAIALPLSRAARAVRPNERAPLRGGAAKPTRGEPAAAASTPEGQRSRAAGGSMARDKHAQAPARKTRPLEGQRLTGVPGWHENYCLRIITTVRTIKNCDRTPQIQISWKQNAHKRRYIYSEGY